MELKTLGQLIQEKDYSEAGMKRRMISWMAEEKSYRLGYYYGFVAFNEKTLTEDEIMIFRNDCRQDKYFPSGYARGLHHGWCRAYDKTHTLEQVVEFLKGNEPDGWMP